VLVVGNQRRLALHRSRQTTAEWLYQAFQWPATGRAFKGNLVASLAHARVTPARRRLNYSTIRRTSVLETWCRPTTPAQCPICDGTGRCAQSGARRTIPLQHRTRQAQTANRLYPSVGEKKSSRQSLHRNLVSLRRGSPSIARLLWRNSEVVQNAGGRDGAMANVELLSGPDRHWRWSVPSRTMPALPRPLDGCPQRRLDPGAREVLRFSAGHPRKLWARSVLGEAVRLYDQAARRARALCHGRRPRNG
jgi:hypothetical protein